MLVFSLVLFASRAAGVVVKIPAHAVLTASPALVIPRPWREGECKIYELPPPPAGLALTASDPFGARVTVRVTGSENDIAIPSGIITLSNVNPESLPVLPRLCPRLRFEPGSDGEADAVYDARRDIMNARPTLQLTDPDARASPAQRRLLDAFDGCGSLDVRRVRIAYDYEDTAILDYDGAHPITGKSGHRVFEGEGGFYANFHYAVVPFDDRYAGLARQELLHLVQGRLAEIDRDDLIPPVRAHSFLPGPYLSREKLYEMCEWGDTARQAPVQELRYEGLALWDWDIAPPEGPPYERLLLVVWEGDEEGWMVADGLLDPFYLTDDVVGVFTVDKSAAEAGLVLKNERGDFEIEVRNGDGGCGKK